MATKKRDFNQVNTGRVFDTIAEATAAPDPVETREEPPEIHYTHEPKPQPARKKYKARKEYTEEEALQMLANMETAGKKGLKLKRVNFGFAPDTYEYVSVMARARGVDPSKFINMVVRDHMKRHKELYAEAVVFCKKIDSMDEEDES